MKQLLIIFFLAAAMLFGQSDNIAVIGGKPLTVKEFQQRYELAPQFNRLYKGSEEQQKKAFLFSLIAEKLFALEAQGLMLDTVKSVAASIKAFREMFMRDELYRQEVRNKSQQYYINIYKTNLRSSTKIETRYLVFSSPESAASASMQLHKGVSFDSLFTVRSDSNLAGALNVTTGIFDMPLENEIFALREGEFSEPLVHDKAYYIFYIDSKTDKLFEGVENPQKVVQRIEKYAREQAEDTRYREFMAEFFGNIKAEANVPLLKYLAEKTENIFLENNALLDKGKEPVKTLTMRDILNLQKMIPEDTLSIEYIQLADTGIVLLKFLEYLRYEEITLDTLSSNAILNELNSQTKRFIEHHYLTKEAYRRGLDEDPNVLYTLRMWKDYFLSRTYQEQFSDSAGVSDEEVLAYYNRRYDENAGGLYVNITEVLVDSLKTADFILTELDKGTPINELAANYSKREWAKERGGVFGLFPVTAYGDIGRIAAGMKIGEIFGPLIVPEGYSIFQLTEKKEMEMPGREEFEKVKESLRQDLSYRKYHDTFENNAVKLARKYNISVDYDVLESLEVTHINAMMFRLIGFGGKVSAVPITLPFTEWINRLEEEGIVLP